MAYLSRDQKRRAEIRLNRARMVMQEWRTIRREGVLYTAQGPITEEKWRANFRKSVRHALGDTGNYGVAEAAICQYVKERDGGKYDEIVHRHVGAYRNASGPDASRVYKRVAKWRRIAQERNKTP